MKVGFVLLLLLVASASASLFNGGDVKPNDNPFVDKYHATSDIKGLRDRTIANVVIGVLGAILLFVLTILYYTYRCCRTCWCSCIKACRVDKKRGRSGSLDEEIRAREGSAVLSWILRISLILLFLLTFLLIVIGFVASTQVHKNIVKTTQTIDDTVSTLNQTAYNTNYTLTHLINISVSQTTINDLKHLINETNSLAQDTHDLNTMGPHVDSIRHSATLAVYAYAFIPILIGIIAAAIGKGRAAFVMSAFIPLLAISCWILFAFHYSMFLVNVDACYAVDAVLLNSSSPSPSSSKEVSYFAVFDCESYAAAYDPIISNIGQLTKMTKQAINATQDQKERIALNDQLNSLYNVTADLKEWENCTGITNLLTAAYPDICGKAIEASLFLWRSQIGLTVVLVVTFIIGLIGERKIIGKRDKPVKGDYSTLALLN